MQHKSDLAAFSRIADGGPELARAFFSWYGQATAAGALPARLKGLLALACAHAVPCPWCIDAWTESALERGADLEELTEAVHLASWVAAEAVRAQSGVLLEKASQLMATSRPLPGHSELHYGFDQQSAARLRLQVTPELEAAALRWREALHAPGALDPADRALLLVGLAHALPAPLLLASASDAALAAGWSAAALTEAVHVAAALRAGATLVHTGILRRRIEAHAANPSDEPASPPAATRADEAASTPLAGAAE